MQFAPIRYLRAWKIALRTVHLVAASLLVGAYAFGATGAQMKPLYALIFSGTGMMFLEAYPRLNSVFDGWAVLTWTKLVLLWMVPRAGTHKLALLVAVVVIASVGSHMPARFRHYSLLYRRVIKE